jgi:molybdopterin-guanine dinucleotide biosynthesis protein A
VAYAGPGVARPEQRAATLGDVTADPPAPDPAPPGGVVCVVLAGGTSRRFGGGDKTAAALGGTTVTGALVASLGALPVVVVGPEAGGGPAAALAAGLARSAGSADDADVVVALAGDLPFAGTAVPRLVAALRAAPDDADAVLGVDPGGRRQFLLAAYRAAPLRTALGAGAEQSTDRSMRSVVAALRVAEVPVTATEALDVDTADDLARARETARQLGSGA